MGSLTGLPRKEERTPISHEVEKHNRPFDRNNLPVARNGRVLTDEERKATWAAELEKAMAEIVTLTPTQARDLMVRVAPYQLECYLLAEEYTQNRSQLLGFFPKPGQRARQRYPNPRANEEAPAPAPPKKTPARKPRARKTVPPVEPTEPAAVEAEAGEENLT